MKVRIQYTAQLRAAVGCSEEEVDAPDGGTLADLLTTLATERRPESAPFVLTTAGELQPSLLVAVNARGVSPREARSTVLQANDVITLMPPIAGG